ncbi:MAG: ABC transporter permease [Microthrixaceae bacterium]|nr:ABC transporter permease [Microthrixaceae bacterium]
MTSFVLRRLVSLAFTLLGGFTVLFVLFFALPSDPAEVIAGGNGKNPPQSVIDNVTRKYHLDESIPKQYVRRLWETMTLSGESFRTREPLSDTVADRLPNSLRLAIWAMAIEVTVGVGTGVLSARRRNSLVDTASTLGTAIVSAIPVFVLAYLLRQVTGVYAFQHQWPEWARLPVLSEADRGWYLGIIPNLDQLEQIIQPALVLASVSTVVVARLTRTTMLEAAGSDHVRTARAKGLKERQVLSRHTLRNALIPVVTFVGIDFGTLVGFAILTETVFGWPGLGSRVARAAGQSDLPVVLTLSMVVMALYGIANLIVDVSYAKLDPRIRLGGAR